VRRVIVTRAFKDLPFPPGPEVVVVERDNLPYRLGELEILGPPPWEKFGRPAAANETSVVVRTDGLLLPGDIEERGVEELLGLPDLRARVLVLPHHGKHHRLHAELVRRVDPEMILVSGPEGYASPEVLQALPRPPRLTGREGAIEIELLPDVVRPWRR
ncbi:MAG TPA: hypothetical protein VEJ18_14795, partial [Planctomycetota bacterium]|nr:hypothetical protein [Planctomycetota bacterium]